MMFRHRPWAVVGVCMLLAAPACRAAGAPSLSANPNLSALLPWPTPSAPTYAEPVFIVCPNSDASDASYCNSASPPVTVTLTASSVAVPASTSTALVPLNKGRKSLQICGPITGANTWEVAYGSATASPTSSVAYGPAGISLCQRWGPGDGVPTNAVAVYSSVAALFQIEEGN